MCNAKNFTSITRNGNVRHCFPKSIVMLAVKGIILHYYAYLCIIKINHNEFKKKIVLHWKYFLKTKERVLKLKTFNYIIHFLKIHFEVVNITSYDKTIPYILKSVVIKRLKSFGKFIPISCAFSLDACVVY